MRRHDVDWLRVILFGLLIWFHYAVFSLGTLEGEGSRMEVFNLPLFFIIGGMHQWRLAALFVISGMGTAFAFRRRTWGVYIKERFSRLGIPLLFGTTSYSLASLIRWQQPLGYSKSSRPDNMQYGHLCSFTTYWFIHSFGTLFSHIRQNPDGKIVQMTRFLLNVRYGMGLLLLPHLVLSLSNVLFKLGDLEK